MNLADIGWMTPPNAIDAFVQQLLHLNENRSELVQKMENARKFALDHSFESEFKSRIDQLWWIACDAKSPNRTT
jgi:hypothetical protein